jgi:hypothetical protein
LSAFTRRLCYVCCHLCVIIVGFVFRDLLSRLRTPRVGILLSGFGVADSRRFRPVDCRGL